MTAALEEYHLYIDVCLQKESQRKRNKRSKTPKTLQRVSQLSVLSALCPSFSNVPSRGFFFLFCRGPQWQFCEAFMDSSD